MSRRADLAVVLVSAAVLLLLYAATRDARAHDATQTAATPREPVAAAVVPASASGAVPARYPASATWCAPTATQCQGWGGDAKFGAVFGFRFGDRPYWVRVTRGEAFVDVLVVSFCACRETDRAIDLSPSAFQRLGRLSEGRIAVEVEVLDWPWTPDGDPPPNPADDRMRIEDGGPKPTVPPTDQEGPG